MRITGRMVARQARLAGRSLRAIGTEPSRARDLPRLIRTRGRSTVSLRLPWLPFRLIDDLGSVVGPGTRVFEYGGGGSTLWFLDRGAQVVTVEHEPAWIDALSRTVGERAAWTKLARSADNDFADYVAAISAFPDDYFDVVVVDGRERVRCFAASLTKVRRGGLLILDDTDRERYAPALASVDWPRRDIVGFAPAKPTLAYTTVFTRGG